MATSEPDTPKILKVLLVEDSGVQAKLIQMALAGGVGPTQFDVEWVEQLSTAMERLTKDRKDVVLLDLSLPDSQGIETCVRLHADVPDVPIVVLSGLEDEAVATEAVRQGAQDYLLKSQVDGNLLARAIRYAIERHRMYEELRTLSIVDELTGLHNRRGFLTLAQQHAKLAKRNKQPFFLLVADVDHLKAINDTHGHQQGDQALKDTATMLKGTFRDSDIVGRVGGDEFMVLAIDATPDNAQLVTARLQERLKEHNAQAGRPYTLSISIGIASHNPPEQPVSLDDLIAQADLLMYERKRTL